jgi:serine/threonine protein kinase
LGAEECRSAPEVIKFHKYSSKSDVWSFGICLYEIITFGRVPYGGMSNVEVIQKVVDENYRLPRPSECPDDWWDLIMRYHLPEAL